MTLTAIGGIIELFLLLLLIFQHYMYSTVKITNNATVNDLHMSSNQRAVYEVIPGRYTVHSKGISFVERVVLCSQTASCSSDFTFGATTPTGWKKIRR